MGTALFQTVLKVSSIPSDTEHMPNGGKEGSKENRECTHEGKSEAGPTCVSLTHSPAC